MSSGVSISSLADVASLSFRESNTTTQVKLPWKMLKRISVTHKLKPTQLKCKHVLLILGHVKGGKRALHVYVLPLQEYVGHVPVL